LHGWGIVDGVRNDVLQVRIDSSLVNTHELLVQDILSLT
jgi:hypothetical protein